MKPKFLEILAHPLRQEILVYIEQEGETGYKDLKNKFNVATGTLYHHLRFLKGLIEQDSNKKYILTDEGRKALNVIFQEQNPAEEPIHDSQAFQSTYSVTTPEQPTVTNLPNANELIEPVESTEEKTIENIQNNHPTKTSSNLLLPPFLKNKRKSFFNVNVLVNTVPNSIYKLNIGIFIILPIVLFMIQPKVVFFHFIPIKITNSIYSAIMIIFPIFNLIILVIISFLKQEKITLPTLSILLVYYNTIFIFTIIFNLFNLLTNDIVVRLFSLIIQGLFIIFWTLCISLQYYSWEKSLFLAIVQNYILFLF